MEYVDGEDLASLLRRIGRLPGDKAVEIARQLCAGLAAAHDRGVLHRDLKPGNVMLDGRGRVRITDFGLAIRADDDKGGTEVGGTPAYMAPEQLAGKGASVQSDLYALGLVLYELFTGRKAFEAATLADWRRKHSEEQPTAPSTVTPGLEPAVERAILRCLEKDPGQRPRSAAAVAAALPGGDPLAAALAAGETPSPEMVAAAGSDEGHEARGGLGLPDPDPRGIGARRLSLAACLPPWARAAGEAARGPRRTVEGDHPEARLHREAARHRVGLFRKRRVQALGRGARQVEGPLEGHGRRASGGDLLLVPAEPRPAHPRALPRGGLRGRTR